MELNEIFTWDALEYEEKTRSKDWFWALGIIVVTSAIASIMFGNYFFVALIIISGALLGFFAVKKPGIVTYELNEKGLKIRNRLYPYDHIKAFWVQAYHPLEINREGFKAPTLFIHSARVFLPIFSVPIEETSAEHIRSIMLSKNVAEVEMKEHPAEKIMETLGF